MTESAMRLLGLVSLATLAGCIPSLDDRSDDRPPLPVQRNERADRYPAPGERDWQPQRGDEEVTALPAPRPAWESRPVIADAQDVPSLTYTVAAGDTLNRIAARTGASADAIARANDLPSPYAVREGQRLSIPGGRYHLVRTGESGIAIARAYGVPWSRVVETNGLVDPFILRTGQRVLIPDLTPAAPGLSSAAQRAAAFRLDIDDILTGGEPALANNARPSRAVPGPSRVLPATAAVAPPARFAGGGFAWPVQGRLLSRFGPGQTGERRNGVTIAVPLNTPIRAAADGVVAYVGTGIVSLGGLVIVKHGSNWTSVYGYASKLLVQRGQAVKKGQTLALSGETGAIERPALLFELRKGRTPVNPEDQLPRL
ncbi:M23 family metallopeptidase [Sphingomonas sp.]|jgi:murein DD-endopeptidase MepM/ murein hydrolase activator NlpD|uniref:M23 family metallopeptidase n=1 Tax=Sphingomonas sp. TaxID=28214 RepID=UPI002D7FC950|nr:M23 family metallopeptidase [Sphingomonas sp.]HEU0044848.1 M23 family metallopeptidase [Sphingomonas sp.]